MKYPNNDLWSVRQIEFLEGALEGYENTSAVYYPNQTLSLNIPKVSEYKYVGVLNFPDRDRTIIFEQGDNFGLSEDDIVDFLKTKNITFERVE